MKLSDIPTERLQQVAENFASSKSDSLAGVFFEYPPSPETTFTFTKNEILEELESRRVEEGITGT